VPARKAERPTKDWYSISVDTLRGWGLLLGILAAAGLGWLALNAWERRSLERDAREAIEEVAGLLGKVQPGGRASEFKSEFTAAYASFEQARAEYARAEYREAARSASRSRNLVQWLLEALSPGGAPGQARFLSVQGEVEFRRANGGDWEEARVHVPLRPGDYVRTGGGSAEILFLDGTLYAMRPNTQIIVASLRPGARGTTEQSVRMEYGWLDLNTADRPSKVVTPSAEARVEQKSEAFVAVDKASKRGRFGAIRGVLELAAKGGLTREVKELEQVVQTGDLLSAPEPLPGRPEPLDPMDNYEVDPGRGRRLVLTWKPVSGASRYALQVSRNHLFVDNIIDVANRTKTQATLGIQGEGTFQWRVAAFDRGGQPGPWSAARKFRVASFRSGGGPGEGDKTPPPLDLAGVKTYGSIFIVGGKSEPGSQVFVNEEPVKVEADGSFTKTIQLTKEGWSFIEIKARDVWGNESVSRQRVFVENP
jgi:hypothetical protein